MPLRPRQPDAFSLVYLWFGVFHVTWVLWTEPAGHTYDAMRAWGGLVLWGFARFASGCLMLVAAFIHHRWVRYVASFADMLLFAGIATAYLTSNFWGAAGITYFMLWVASVGLNVYGWAHPGSHRGKHAR